MRLPGHAILIVESETTAFVIRLQAAIQETGAETLVVRDPYSADGEERLREFAVSAAVINAQHGRLAERRGIPCVVYEGEAPEQIVSRDRGLLTGAAAR